MSRQRKMIAGLPVIDGTRKLTIKITPHDVKRGRVKKPGTCAAAQAVCRLPGCSAARIHLGRVYLRKNDHWVRLKTGSPLRSEIIAFDRGGRFAPGSYTLSPPTASDKPAYRRTNYKKKCPSGKRPAVGKSPRRLHVVSDVRERA